MLEFVKFLENSYLLQINPFHFLQFCNFILYQIIPLFDMKDNLKFIYHLILY
jgi:hypothetical protein